MYRLFCTRADLTVAMGDVIFVFSAEQLDTAGDGTGGSVA
jgi:hypothetical protein